MDPPVLLAWLSASFAAATALVTGFLEHHPRPSGFLAAGREARDYKRCEGGAGPHWLFVAGMAVLAVEGVFTGLSAAAVLPDRAAYWQTWRLSTWACLPGIWLWFSLSYARDRSRKRRLGWRIVLAGIFLAPASLVVLFRRGLLVSVGQAPPSYQWVFGLGLPGMGLEMVFLLSALLVLMNLEQTFRASVGTMRWRIKFLILGLGLLFVVRAHTSIQALLFRASSCSLQTLASGALLLACLVTARSLLRIGHFEVSVYPSQALLHSSLTVLLAGIYLIVVGVLAKVAVLLGGDTSLPLKAFVVLVAMVLLATLLLSDHVRLLLKRLVSRHFQRPLHDYPSVWRTFARGTARRVEESDLCATLVKLVSEVFQALSVTICLADERKKRLLFAASTSLSEAKAARLNLDPEDAAQVIGALSSHPEPTDLDASKEVWASALRRAHPEEFPRAGHRVCVPLCAGGELLGVMTVGDRVDDAPLSVQDFDLLQSVGDQAATSLLNIQLSRRLVQAKQIEAFQAMSAFFVHDLKNTTSTLSLMLKNLPVHYQDPQFREETLRGISQTVSHINDLISRLSLLRNELSIQPVASDLNQLVTSALEAWQPTPQAELVTQLRPVPNVMVDPAQIRKVVLNLVLNAREALSANGQIRVETSQQNGWVVLAVLDNGCGMNADFMEHSLFRPFQTTKKNGLGIGMFHCKAIVEAHRGHIEVQSEPGKGTAFRVLLPRA